MSTWSRSPQLLTSVSILPFIDFLVLLLLMFVICRNCYLNLLLRASRRTMKHSDVPARHSRNGSRKWTRNWKIRNEKGNDLCGDDCHKNSKIALVEARNERRMSWNTWSRFHAMGRDRDSSSIRRSEKMWHECVHCFLTFRKIEESGGKRTMTRIGESESFHILGRKPSSPLANVPRNTWHKRRICFDFLRLQSISSRFLCFVLFGRAMNCRWNLWCYACRSGCLWLGRPE
jgi:hypothetical protein